MHYEFEGFRLDTGRRLLFGPGSDVPAILPSKALDTLAYLVEQRDQLIEKRALIDAIWPRAVVEENSLDRNISLLRKTLGEAPGENRFIVTVPGRGYRFVARVAVIADLPPVESAAEATAVSAPTSPVRRRSQLVGAALLGGALLAGAAVLTAWMRHSPQPPPTPPAQKSMPPSVAVTDGRDRSATRASVAVMPFANLTGDVTMDYFGDGLAEELIHSLARVPGLKVPARTSSFAYKGRNLDVRQIGRDLGVTHLLEGSVRAGDNNMRVTAQLVDASTGFHVWSQTYDQSPGDVFKLQDELAIAIAQTLTPGLHSAYTGAGISSPTTNVEAYRMFMQANALVGATEGNLQQAMKLYDRAIELDPRFARALSSRATTRLTFLTMSLPVPGGVDAAERDARQALALDPDFAGAHAALAVVHTARARWVEADAEYQLALTKGRNDPAILISRSTFLASVGRLQEAVRASERAYELAPLALPAIAARAVMYSLLERDEEALRDAKLGVSMGAATQYGALPLVLSNEAWRSGRFEEGARHILQSSAKGAGAVPAVTLAFESAHHPEKRKEASRALHELTARVPMDVLDRRRGTLFMILFTMAGDLDAAYSAANQAVNAHEKSGNVGVNWAALWIPTMQPFREDPRFQLFVRRVKLMDYWKVHGPPDNCTLVEDRVVCKPGKEGQQS